MIEIQHLTVKKQDHIILSDICMSFLTGSITCVTGSSGSGKSTLLRALNNLESVSGKILFNGKLIKHMPHFIGMVFQTHHLFEHLSVLENVWLPQRLKNNAKSDSAKELLISLGIDTSMFHRSPRTLSGGQRQRVAIARTLILDPYAICFDEPTASLDRERSKEFCTIIKSLAHKNKIIIVATHDMYLVEDLACATYVLKNGRIS